MAIRGITFTTAAFVLGTTAFILHLLAICSPHWKIIKRAREPIMSPVSYGLWERCEHENKTFIEQGITIGTRPNVLFCYPNRYLRYSPSSYQICKSYSRKCPVLTKTELPEGCSCRYLPSAKGLQWLTVLAAICLGFGLILLYLKTIATPQNNSAAFLLSHGPFICFLLTLLLMSTGLILFSSYFRRDTYEDHFFPLETANYNTTRDTYNLYSVRQYAKVNGTQITAANLAEAEAELIQDGNSHYHTVIGRATVYEIIATVIVLLSTGLTYWLISLSRSEDKL